jgi:hypothetical protein
MSEQEKKTCVGNPLKVDPELKGLLDKLEFVKTYRAFQRWRGSFLGRFECFLEDENVEAANGAYKSFSCSMDGFVKLVSKVEGFVEKGDLTVDHYTVKARNCLAEMSKTMTRVIEELEALIPETGQLEKNRGYNKFHLGSVLIRDSFEEYGRLSQCGDVLQHMRKESLEKVADKQILEEMSKYSAKLQKFCDVMADLGLYEVMLKCREFANQEETVEAGFIFLDIKTGGIGELSREDCLSKHVINVSGKDEEGNDVYAEAETDDEKKKKILKLITANPRLGVGFGNRLNTYDEEGVDVSEMEKIKNMWGVKLKKTPKNEKGEELVFLDQKTCAFGELSRRTFMEKELLTETKDEMGHAVLGEAALDFEERSNLIETIRTMLKVGVTEN